MTQLKLITYGVILAALAGTLTTCYLKGRSDATQKTDLAAARAAIKESRERQKIEYATNTRVDAESTATQTAAKAADDEIERIRTTPRVSPRAAQQLPSVPGVVDTSGSGSDDRDAARVMQLAREARAAALESSARLQSTRAGAR